MREGRRPAPGELLAGLLMPAVMLTENDRGRRGGRRVPQGLRQAAADLLQEGRNSIDLEDVNGYKIIRSLICAAEAGGCFVEYY